MASSRSATAMPTWSIAVNMAVLCHAVVLQVPPRTPSVAPEVQPLPDETGCPGHLGQHPLPIAVGVEVVPAADLAQHERVVEHGVVVELAVRAVGRARLRELAVEADHALLHAVAPVDVGL